MSAFVKFVPADPENARSDRTPAKVAKAAKVEPETPNFSNFSNFSSPVPGNAESDPPNFSNFSNFSSPVPKSAESDPENARSGRTPANPAKAAKAAPDPKLSPAERRAWADALCRRLHAAVTAASPEGLGRWEPAWEMVAAPSDRLLETLADWEGGGDVADLRAAEQAADAVLHAWEHAARRWEAECAAFERWAIQREDDPDTPTPPRWEEL